MGACTPREILDSQGRGHSTAAQGVEHTSSFAKKLNTAMPGSRFC